MAISTERQKTLSDYIKVLNRGRWVIITSFLVVVMSTAYFTFTTEPIYEASAKLMIEQEGGVGQSIFKLPTYIKDETLTNNQVEIIKSRTLAEKVIAELQISEYANQLTLLGYPPPPSTQMNNPINSVKKWVTGIFSHNNSEVVATSTPSFDWLVAQLRKNLSITPIRETDMIEIRYKAIVPFEAAYIANEIATVYKRENQLQSRQEVGQIKLFLEEQLKQIEEQLRESEEALKTYKETKKVAALSEETEELVRRAAEFESMYKGAQTNLVVYQERLKYVNEQLDKSKQNFDIDAISASPYLVELKRQIAEKEGRLATFMAGLMEVGVMESRRREIDYTQKQIDALKEKFKEEVAKLAATEVLDPVGMSETLFAQKINIEAELQSLNPKVEALGSIVDRYNEQLEALPEKSLQLARLSRSAQVDEKIFIMLQEKYQESRITEVGQLGNVRIIDNALPPKYPVSPRTHLNMVLSILVGLGLGVAITFILEYMDTSIRTIEDIQDAGLPLMGTIPVIKPEEHNGHFKNAFFSSSRDTETRTLESRLVTHLRPKSPISEAYRTLRTNIQFAKSDAPVRSIIVTSSGPKEGKSTTVANLAITMAQMGTKTLLIDADLRRPVLHKLFNIDRKIGLSNLLVGKAGLEEVAKRSPIDNLYVIPCGTLPPNPSELLASKHMHDALEMFKEKFEMILFDTPPVIAVTDAPVLATVVDGIVLIVDSGHTNRDALLRAVELLQHVKASILGVLLNNIQVTNMYGSYYYYYYYHYYYSKNGDKKRKKMRKKRRRSQRY